jgi:SWI/SNF-related matrix-associated actin-dependent regulator of chromatin subfamily D
MYPNPMQQPQQPPPMQRPPTMMNPSAMPQPNTAVGVPSMRPMVASSPMQVSMLQQPTQTSMMVRPGGSPYGVVNRAALYDKNKRSTYSNDLRQQPMVQPGQQPPPMAYSNVMGPSQPMMSNAIPAGGGPMRQKKRKRLTEKVIHKQIRSLVPESQAYIELLRLEQKLDSVLMRKRLDIQETLKRPQKIKKKLRIFISHQYPVRFDADTTGIDDEQVQYWEMRVEGRLLDDPNTNKYDQGKAKRKFSSFFRSLVIELDKDLYGPDNHLVEWHRTNATAETDGFQVRRPGDQNVKCTILMVLDHSPPQFRLDSRLARLLSLTNGTRQTIIHAMWQYIKTHKLQDSEEREFINCDPHLHAIFDCTRVRFSDLPAKLNKLILPSEPIIINHTLCLGTDPKKHACYDIDVEVDDPVRDSMRTYLSPQNTHELEELDGKILQYIDSINQLKQSREFYLSFADDPQGFICKWLASQSRDLKMITDSTTGNAEEERRADYYTEQWSYEAVSRYFYNKVQQKRAELEQALGIRNG